MLSNAIWDVGHLMSVVGLVGLLGEVSKEAHTEKDYN